MTKPLFTIPITTGGNFVCTQLKDRIYLLSFSSAPDNRITPAFLTALLLALDTLERQPDLYPPGVLITTSAIPKFFSNGFNLPDLTNNTRFYEDYILPVLRRFITYPMFTVAVINSHAFGAGVFLALAHDYTLMNPQRGWWCLPEVDLGVAIPSTLARFVQAKLPGGPHVYRDAVLQGTRYTGPQAAERGLVDGVGGIEDALQMAEERKWVEKVKLGAVGALKEDLWRDVLETFDRHGEQVAWRERLEKRKEVLAREADDRIAAWGKKNKAKL